jgi:phenylacetate-CoA ligase
MYALDIETMERADLAALQLSRLRTVIERTETHVPHYRRSFSEASVSADKIKSLDDIRRFPFTVKDDLRAAYPFGMLAVPRDKLVRIHASSGSTGQPTVVGYSQADLEMWDDLMARSLAAMGARPGEVFHNAYGYGLFTGGLGFHGGATRLGMAVVPVSGGNTERQVQLIEDFGASVLGATPSYALQIAETARAMGVDLVGGTLRLGTFGAEPWSAEMRREIEQALGIKALDMYGLSEIIGPGVATECEAAQDGLHFWEDHFLFEIVDPSSGEALPAGDVGELVITTLTKEALPMIRYRTRDLTRVIDAPCACGRTHRRIEKVSGRNDDMLIIRGVNLFPTQIEAALVDLSGVAPQYLLIVTREGTLDTLAVEVEAAPDVGVDPAEFDKIAKAVAERIKARVGVTCSVRVRDPGSLPRGQGKAVRVQDLRKK